MILNLNDRFCGYTDIIYIYYIIHIYILYIFYILYIYHVQTHPCFPYSFLKSTGTYLPSFAKCLGLRPSMKSAAPRFSPEREESNEALVFTAKSFKSVEVLKNPENVCQALGSKKASWCHRFAHHASICMIRRR